MTVRSGTVVAPGRESDFSLSWPPWLAARDAGFSSVIGQDLFFGVLFNKACYIESLEQRKPS